MRFAAVIAGLIVTVTNGINLDGETRRVFFPRGFFSFELRRLRDFVIDANSKVLFELVIMYFIAASKVRSLKQRVVNLFLYILVVL